jgi:hypothetical protein
MKKTIERQIVDLLKKDDCSIDNILVICSEPCLRLSMESVKVALRRYEDYRAYEEKIEYEKKIHERVMKELMEDQEKSRREMMQNAMAYQRLLDSKENTLDRDFRRPFRHYVLDN